MPVSPELSAAEFVAVIVRDGRPGAPRDRRGERKILQVMHAGQPVAVGDGLRLDDGTQGPVVRIASDETLSGNRGPRRIQTVHLGLS